MAVTMGATSQDGTIKLPAIQVSPRFLFPSDGRYEPVSISGGVTSTYTMNLEGAYAVFPKPATTARVLAQLPLPDPTSTAPIKTPVSGTFTATVPGSTTPQTGSYTLEAYAPPVINPPTTPGGVPTLTGGAGRYSVTLPGYKYPMTVKVVWLGSLEQKNGTYVISPSGHYQVFITTLPVSDFENSVINARLNARPGPTNAVLQVTDQYRQDEPRVTVPLTPLAAPTIAPFASPPIFVFADGKGIKYTEQVFVPTFVSITRIFSYQFNIHLQALKRAGTGGRQYITNVSSEDADDGGSVNAAAVVPPNA
jgi:hypothetical protein